LPADTRIFNLVAIGGMGKSALTWKWFNNDIAPNELPKLPDGSGGASTRATRTGQLFTPRAGLRFGGYQKKKSARWSHQSVKTSSGRFSIRSPSCSCSTDWSAFSSPTRAWMRPQMLDDDLDEETAHEEQNVRRHSGKQFAELTSKSTACVMHRCQRGPASCGGLPRFALHAS